jgi:uncharacterized membrane protein
MGVVAAIFLLWVAFAASHMALSSLRLRPQLVEKLGALGFQAAYSTIALAIFVPLVMLYFDNKHAGPFLWWLGASPAVRWGMYALMAVALALVVGGATSPSPASLVPGKAEVKGLFRITRHPLLMGLAIFGMAHLLAARVNAAELAFFGGFVIFTVVGCWHQDQRKLATLGDAYRHFYDETPFLPFTGPGAIRGLRERPVAALLGAVVAGVLLHFHSRWFGGAP